MDITTVGIDIAKRIFQIHGVNKNGKTVLKKKLMRDQVRSFAVGRKYDKLEKKYF